MNQTLKKIIESTTMKLLQRIRNLLPQQPTVAETMEEMRAKQRQNLLRGGKKYTFNDILDYLEHGVDLTPNNNGVLVINSITEGYEADKWGLLRIALDGVQNHLPGDAKGSETEIFFGIRPNGSETPKFSQLHDLQARLRSGEIKIEDISEIQIVDDGRGYHYPKLGYLYSDKKDLEDAVGEKGEGLKMISMAAMRHNIDIMLASREWMAMPRLKDVAIDIGENTRSLQYLVLTNMPRRNGSITRFTRREGQEQNFAEFASIMADIGKYVLRFREGYAPLAATSEGDVVEEGGNIFIKGTFVTGNYQPHFILSYNLPITTSRDRDLVDDGECRMAVGKVLAACNSPDVISRFLTKCMASKESGIAELIALNGNPFDTQLWANTFRELNGGAEQMAIQDTDNPTLIHALESQGYKLVAVENPQLLEVLKKAKFPMVTGLVDEDMLVLYLGEKLDFNRLERKGIFDTRLDIEDIRGENWPLWAIIRDNVMNHYAYGGDVKFEVLTQEDGRDRWLSPGLVARYSNIRAIRLSDSGRGFDRDSLILFSHDERNAKRPELKWGMFGEGMKRCDAYMLNKGIVVKRRSQDWIAVAQKFKRESRPGKEFLGYDVANERMQQGSSTTFTFSSNQTDAARSMLSIIQNIGEIMLPLDPDYRPLFRARDIGDIVAETASAGGRAATRLYYRHVSLTGPDTYLPLADKALFNYNLDSIPRHLLSPDRNQIPHHIVEGEIEKIISACDSSGIISKIIKMAGDKDGQESKELVEFRQYSLDEEKKRIWKSAFEGIYKIGNEDVVLDTTHITGSEEARKDAEAMGYKVVRLHKDIVRTLNGCGIFTDEEVGGRGANYTYVSIDELTDKERAVLHQHDKILQNIRDSLKEIDSRLYARYRSRLEENYPVSRIKVFSKATNKAGRVLNTVGVCNLLTGDIQVHRQMLQNTTDYGRTLTHEHGHRVTLAGDYSREFTDFFESLADKATLKGVELIN